MKPDTGERLRGAAAPDLWPDIERRIDGRNSQPMRSTLRRAAPVVAGLLVVVAFGWAFVGLRTIRGGGQGQPPALTSSQGAAVSGLTAHVQIVPDAEVSATLRRDGVVYGNPFAPIPGGTSVIVRIDWTQQPSAPPGSSYTVVLMNKNNLGPKTAAGPLFTWPPATTGWDGRFDGVAARYPWLKPAVDVCDASGCTSWTTGATFRPQTSGPLWIVDRWPGHDANGKAGQTPDPLIGVIFANLGRDQIYWAQRVYG